MTVIRSIGYVTYKIFKMLLLSVKLGFHSVWGLQYVSGRRKLVRARRAAARIAARRPAAVAVWPSGASTASRPRRRPPASSTRMCPVPAPRRSARTSPYTCSRHDETNHPRRINHRQVTDSCQQFGGKILMFFFMVTGCLYQCLFKRKK